MILFASPHVSQVHYRLIHRTMLSAAPYADSTMFLFGLTIKCRPSYICRVTTYREATYYVPTSATSQTQALFIRGYRLLTRLYPRTFREQFGEELEDTFIEALQDAQASGEDALWWFFLREIIDLPLSILREHLDAARQRRIARLQEEEMAKLKTSTSARRARRLVLLWIALISGLLLWVIVPFFTLALPQAEERLPTIIPESRIWNNQCDEICGSFYVLDGKDGHWEMDDLFPGLLGILGFAAFLNLLLGQAFIPLLLIVGIPVLLASWRGIPYWERGLTVVTYAVALSLEVLLVFTSYGDYIIAWVLD